MLFRVPRVGCFRHKLPFCNHHASAVVQDLLAANCAETNARNKNPLAAFASFTERQRKAPVKWKTRVKEEKRSAASLTGDADDEGCGLSDHRRRPGRVDGGDLPRPIQAEGGRIRWGVKPGQDVTWNPQLSGLCPRRFGEHAPV